ncbi:MAG: hypothetical protein HWN79_17460 [Candidatus Lokiarchaeota archaeon]|nr:hypothetical protein [Candidatus Lokiarchaeota archaeon]
MNLSIKRIKIQILVIFLLGFSLLIPYVNSIKDTVYLEKWDVASGYELDANEGELISLEFRTYNNPFIVYFRCSEWRVVISHDKTVNKGILEVLESNTFHFYFENIGDTGGGYLEFEIKIIERIPAYNLLIILAIITFVSLISIRSIKSKKKVEVMILEIYKHYRSNKKTL